MKRYEKFVLEAQKGITFELQEGTSGELIIRALSIAEANAVTSENYANPVIPEGYKHIEGGWNNGFVIERGFDGSQFVWVPVGSLDSNGTIIGGNSFTEKFGRRNYRNDEFSGLFFHETLTDELVLQMESVKKYGGFYISRYNISRSTNGMPQSVKGIEPWVVVSYYEAKSIARIIENNEVLKSHLIFGAEYDSVLEWFLKSNARSYSEIVKDSTKWGNHSNTIGSQKRLVTTGSREEYYTNGICDFAGNVKEWTQEKNNGRTYRVIRGGNYKVEGNRYPVAIRNYDCPNICDWSIGFRVALYIK